MMARIGAEGLVGDQPQRGVHRHLLVGEHGLGVLGEPPEPAGALGHLALGLGEGLAHLGGDHVGDVGQLPLEELGHGDQQPGPLLEGAPRPPRRGGGRRGQASLDAGTVVGLEGLDQLAGDGVDGGDGGAGVDRTHPTSIAPPHRRRNGAGHPGPEDDGHPGRRHQPDRGERGTRPGIRLRCTLPVAVRGRASTTTYCLGRL